jgi:MoxR-like ATPase
VSIPVQGVDTEVDSIIETATKILATTPVAYDANKLRESVAHLVARTRGMSLEEAFGDGIQVKKGVKGKKSVERKLTLDAVRQAMDDAKKAGGPPFWVDPNNMQVLRAAVGLRSLGRPANILMVGASGYGKTSLAYRLAEEMGKPIYVINCATATTEEAWLGRMHIDDDGTKYVQSEFLKWVEGVEYEPGIILMDEASRIHPQRMNTLFGLLDWQGKVFVPGLQRYVHLHPDNILIGTANIGVEYGGTARMDKAFKERWGFVVRVGPPPKAAEIDVLIGHSGLDKDIATRLVDIAEMTRKRNDLQELAHPITTRALIDWSCLVSTGLPVAQAAEHTVLELFDRDGGAESDYAKVKLLIQSKTGEKA